MSLPYVKCMILGLKRGDVKMMEGGQRLGLMGTGRDMTRGNRVCFVLRGDWMFVDEIFHGSVFLQRGSMRLGSVRFGTRPYDGLCCVITGVA